ncbi:MAG: DNA topoisomerase, partial [Luteibacter jiangsuensis]
APFITLSLQQAASNRLNFNPDKTMDLAQKLKDAGHITYHRTDNPNIASDALPEIRAVAARMGLSVVDEPRHFDADDDAQEGHPGITPTHWEVEVAGETADERALYSLIRNRAIASQLLDARYAVRAARLTGHVDGRDVVFMASSRSLVDPGWMSFLAGDDSEDADDDTVAEEATQAAGLPDLQAGQQLRASNGSVLEKKTRKPKRYTQASVLKELKARGIGRPSTFAAIVASITDRQYVKVKSRFLEPQPIGFKICDALVGRFAFAEYEYTRNMEVCLDGIAKGKVPYAAIVQSMHAQLASEVANLEATVPTAACPTCGKRLKRHTGKKAGKPYDFYGCSGYPECRARFDVGADGAPKLPTP